MNENEVMKKEREAMKKSHLEALISEWKFQCAEGIYTYPRERMFEICYTDAYEQGRKEATKELEAQIEKMKCCENCAKEFTKDCAWWKRAEENRQINTCKDWEIKEK